MTTAGGAQEELRFHYVLDCPCGSRLTGATEDEIVEVALGHLGQQHPELADNYGREHVLVMARRLVAP